MVEVGQLRVQYVRRSKGEIPRDEHFDHRHGYVIKVMFWGAITIFGTGCLVPVDGTMNAQKYIDILETHLIPLADTLFGTTPWKLLQDGARCHTAATTKVYMEQQGIQCVDWCSYSPDMNPIENVWSVFKRKLYRQGSGNSRQKVIERAQQIWHNDIELRDVARNCVLSMQSRVSALKNSKGGHTHY